MAESKIKVGVCDIYRLRYYRNCCFNDVQFDNIEYFAKTQQTPTKCTHTLACSGDGVKQCTHAFSVLSLHGSVD